MKPVWSLLVILALGACGSGDGAPAGAPCTSNPECASGRCGATADCGSHCLCSDDGDCPAGKHCQMTIDCGPGCL